MKCENCDPSKTPRHYMNLIVEDENYICHDCKRFVATVATKDNQLKLKGINMIDVSDNVVELHFYDDKQACKAFAMLCNSVEEDEEVI